MQLANVLSTIEYAVHHEALHTGYNPLIVALSIVIAVFASYTALDLGSRVRHAARDKRWAWLTGASLAMGGGIWSMHFIGMLAFELGRPAAYDLGTTILSLVIAIVFTGTGFLLVGRHDSKRRDVLIGGPLMGLGVAAMHYTGMAAMRTPANMAYSVPIVCLSVVIAITAATAALWLSFRQHSVWQKLVAANVMGVAVAGMHYTGMAAATFSAEQSSEQTAHTAELGSSQLNLILFVAGATFIILFVAMLTTSLDQQRVQGELLRSEERFRAAVKAVRGFLWTNDASGRMVGEQPGWAAITGQSRAEYEGFGWADAVHPVDAGPSLAAWEETVREKRTFVFEHRLRSKDGGWRHYAIRAVPILDKKGSIREWVGIHTDITEQREAEAQLRESNEEIQSFAHIISHDLRAPLVNIMGFSNELADVQVEVREALAAHPKQAQIDQGFDEALGFIRASVERMERLIAAVLRLSRDGRRTFQLELLNMTSTMQMLVDAQRHQAEAAGAAILIAQNLPSITSDRLAIEQVFANLIDNAIKYLDPARAGRVEIAGTVMGGGIVRYDVTDNGRGINEKDHARIFDLFRRSGPQDQSGEGIGLAYVRSLVRALGGRITVSSDLGKGSTFSVTLPQGGVASEC